LLALAAAPARPDAATQEKLERRCHFAAGRAAARCLTDYVDRVRRCRDDGDAACEERLRAPDGELTQILGGVEAPVRRACTDESAARISIGLGVDRHVGYLVAGCEKWGEQFFEVAYGLGAPNPLSPEALGCRHHVAVRLSRVRDTVIAVSGACNAARFAGRDCRRARRDRKIAGALAAARRGIVKRCGGTFRITHPTR